MFHIFCPLNSDDTSISFEWKFANVTLFLKSLTSEGKPYVTGEALGFVLHKETKDKLTAKYMSNIDGLHRNACILFQIYVRIIKMSNTVSM